MLKQDLATSYDYNHDSCYKNIDDCNFGFIDTSNLKRFLVKCCIYASDALLIAIIRRMDLDADARLSKREFLDGTQPLENFTKGSLSEMKKTVKKQSRHTASASNFRKISASTGKRPMTAHNRTKSPNPYGQTQTFDAMTKMGSQNERDYLAKNSQYRESYGAMDARGGQFKMSSASSNSRKDNTNVLSASE